MKTKIRRLLATIFFPFWVLASCIEGGFQLIEFQLAAARIEFEASDVGQKLITTQKQKKMTQAQIYLDDCIEDLHMRPFDDMRHLTKNIATVFDMDYKLAETLVAKNWDRIVRSGCVVMTMSTNDRH